MKYIKNLTKQEIVLEGFGIIEISESLDGVWNIDLFPSGHKNDREMIRIDTSFGGNDGKYFEYPKRNDNRIEQIYEN